MRGLTSTGCGLLALLLASLVHAQENDEIAEDIANSTVILVEAKAVPVVGQTTLDASAAAEIAGVQSDALKAVQTVAGVARPTASSKGISVWGAAPADTRLYIDEIPVPRLFHIGGYRSILPSHEIESIQLIPGGASARYGRAIGGALSVTSAEVDREQQGVGLVAHADLFDLGLAMSSRFSRDSWISVAGRSSLLSAGFNAVAPARAQELIAVPDYSDLQLRGAKRLRSGETIRLLAIASSDALERRLPSVSPETRTSEQTRLGFVRLGLTLHKPRATGSRKVTLWVGRDQESQEMRFGDVRANDSVERELMGLLLEQRTRVRSWWLLRLGADAELTRSRVQREGALTLPSREGDMGVFGQPPGNRVNEDLWSIVSASVGMFVSSEMRVGPLLRLESGLRFEPTILNGNRVVPVRPSEPAVGYTDLSVAFDPRLRLSFLPSLTWQLFLAGGRYHQQPQAADLSPVFGSPILAQPSALQALAGAEYQKPWAAGNFRAELLAYTASQSELATRSSSPTPGLAALLESTGEGRSFGAQLSLQLNFPKKLSVSLSYALTRAERRPKANTVWRAFDLEQPHVLRAGINWTHSSGWSVGSRFELSSGLPRTPVIGSVFSTSSQQYDPIFGGHNSERLPLFAQLAARVGYKGTHHLGEIRLWLDLQNLSNRRNIEEVFYSADYSSRGFVAGFPLLPVFGMELRI